MADARIFDLSYGHLGQAIYDRESKCWRFSREPGRRKSREPAIRTTVVTILDRSCLAAPRPLRNCDIPTPDGR